MKIHALFVLMFLATSLLKADELEGSPNFLSHHLSNGWSVEIPASWKITTDFNQDISQFIQSASDQEIKNLNVQKSGSINTQLLAFGRMVGKKASLMVSILHNTSPLTQSQLSQMSKEEQANFIKFLRQGSAKSLINNGADPQSKLIVQIAQYEKTQVCVITTISEKENNLHCDMHIPNGEENLVLSFNSKYSDLQVWAPIFDRIVSSVKIP